MKSIAVPLAALLAAVAVAGCGGSAKDETTSAASTPAPTTQTETTQTSTTSTDTTPTTTSKTTTEPANISDAEINPGGNALGKQITVPLANGATLTMTFKKLYDPVKSVSDFDQAPSGSRFVGVTLDADLKGPKRDVFTAVNIVDTTGSELSLSLLADPDCGRNLVNISVIGVGDAKRGCIVAIAPKGATPKEIVVVTRSGRDRKVVKQVRVPLSS